MKSPILFGLVLFGILGGVLAAFVYQEGSIQNSSVLNPNSSLPNFGPAPELTGIAGWINSEPFTLSELKGKVVVIDFWTYSCINCLRTLPYLAAWDEKYRDKGLVIVGVHTPEFAFEQSYDNVLSFVQEHAIQYPVVQDNDYATWRAYKNNYWPRKYVIDREGNIRYDHIGEGAYDETEAVIQELLGTEMPLTGVVGETVSGVIGTPELYLGYTFIRSPLGNAEGLRPGEVHTYTKIDAVQPNTIYLSGSWLSLADAVESRGDSGLELIYTAKNVNIVAGGEGYMNVSVDGIPAEGADTRKGTVQIKEERLYNIVASDGYKQHTLHLNVSDGVTVYTFTFG